MKISYTFQLTEQLIQKGYERMKAAVSVEDAAHQSSTKSLQFQQDEAYIATAIYCDSFLRLKEDGKKIHFILGEWIYI